ncbi:hypothetical protein BDV33DRAFT_168760 [Aspergillus novoparasiticus]|uniref:Uncharacterized protein n=1 Tax=Aspergillus novoparasiticus TaxID=986946 RepID=A0A5N6EY83_9EURO|nr:hypothetical protein BDV33DRAFT_168760 [Aspergillus novoparasiticus]
MPTPLGWIPVRLLGADDKRPSAGIASWSFHNYYLCYSTTCAGAATSSCQGPHFSHPKGWPSVESGRYPVSYVFVALGKENEK